MHTFKKGDEVAIINQTLAGRFVVEGKATIVRPIKDVDDQYAVHFNKYHETVERFVDPSAQADPEGFVQRLNSLRA